MTAIDLSMLVDRLNHTCRKGLEAAAGSALSRTHYNVEIEHWLLQLLDQPGADVARILRAFEIDADRVVQGLAPALDRLSTGNGRAPSLAPELVRLMKAAWLFASVEQNQTAIRSGHLLWSALTDEAVASRLLGAAPELKRVIPDSLKCDFEAVLADSIEAPSAREATPSSRPAAGPGAAAKASKTPAIDRFTADLTAQARAGKIDPIIGRDGEIRQVIDILTRRRQNRTRS